MLASDLNTSPRTFEIHVPIKMGISKKKMGSLNLNIYRNLHHYELSYQKRSFSDHVKPYLKGIPELGTVNLHYRLFYDSKRRIDIMNFGSVVDKYFSDTLVESGILEDDDSKVINHVSFDFGGYSETPYIAVIITETQIRGYKPMQITLNQADIETAVNSYIIGMGIQDTASVKLVFSNNTVSAEVLTKSSLTPSGDPNVKMAAPVEVAQEQEEIQPVPEATEAPKKRRGRKKGSKNKATLEAESESINEDDSFSEDDDDSEEDSDDVADTVSSSTDSDSSGVAEPAEAQLKTSSNPFKDTSPEASEKTKSVSEAEVRKSKNLFGESDEESSKAEDDSSTIPKANDIQAPKVKKSIFDV